MNNNTLQKIQILVHASGRWPLDRAVGGRVEGGIPRAGLDGVATRELGQDTVDGLADHGSGTALIALGGSLDGEVGASFGFSSALVRGAVALGDSVLQGVRVPSISRKRWSIKGN